MDEQKVYVHTIEYYSALKREEMLILATTWMKLGDIMLNEISQSQKGKYMISNIPCRMNLGVFSPLQFCRAV